MARSFNGTSQYLISSSAPSLSLPVTMACWFYANTLTANGVLFSMGVASGDARLQVNANGATDGDPLQAVAYNAAGSYAIAKSSASYSTGVWQHCIAVFASTTSRTIYLNGGSSATNSTDIDSTPGSFNQTLIGARDSSSGLGAFLDGRVAEIGVWATDLDADERAALAAGVSPLLVRPSLLVAYSPLFGRSGASGGEEGWAGATQFTQVASPGVVNHPRIIYPRRRSMIFVPAAVSGAPTITALSAIGITATSAQPRISYS